MEKILALIEEKNSYLEKFCAINSEQIRKLKAGNFEDLENFRETRENILNILKHIDAVLSARAAEIEDENITQIHRAKIKAYLDAKDDLVKVILGQDIDIMGAIEAAKSEIILQLRQVVKGRKAIGAYKSGETDKTVDEEV